MDKPQINIKWTYGDPYEKTDAKTKNPFYNESERLKNITKEIKEQQQKKQIEEIKKFAIGENNIKQLAREFDKITENPEILYRNIAQEGFQKKENKRDNNNNKMLEREMIMQTNQNPFMMQNNYLDDLTIQDEFLKPKNSSFQQ